MAGTTFTKLFYKIGEVCRLTDVQPHILRYWESEFPNLAPRKSRGGQRVYQPKDLEMVLAIKRMLYVEGYTIAGAKKKLSGGRPSGEGDKDSSLTADGSRAGNSSQAGGGSRAGDGSGTGEALTHLPSDTNDTYHCDARSDAPDKRLADALGKCKHEIEDLLKFMG